MPSATTIRLQIESALAERIPAALTPSRRVLRPVLPTGVSEVDSLLEGGLPVGAITEFAGPECSGRTSLALSYLARITSTGSVVAWIDVCDALDPESAAAIGVDLSRMLWVRCGLPTAPMPRPNLEKFQLSDKHFPAPPVKKGLHGGGFGPHPRSEVKGLSNAVGSFLGTNPFAPQCAEPQRRMKPEREAYRPTSPQPEYESDVRVRPGKPWARIEQALRVADLLLQGGGFQAIVLDMANIAPEYTARVPLATWFRFRATADRTQASLLLLTQRPCTNSSGELLLRFQPGSACQDEATVFTGISCQTEVERRRSPQVSEKVVPMRKPVHRETGASWRSKPVWAGTR